MKDHMKPSMREDPDYFILNVGTNDLATDREPEIIAKSIADLASTLKKENNNVCISNIIVRNGKWKDKAVDVNKVLAELCIERNMLLIDNSKRIKQTHLSSRKLHLNRTGSAILQDTYCKVLSDMLG